MNNQDIKNFIKAIQQSQPQLEAQLHRYCAINSGSTHLSGLATMANTLKEAWTPLADKIQLIDCPKIKTINMRGDEQEQTIGQTLFIQKRPELKRRVLLCGHMDTVYGSDHSFQSLQSKNTDMLIGPGVTDMKGGLIVMQQALHTFEQLPIANTLGWDVLINADEEIGSPGSSPFLDKIATRYQAALVYEPSMDTQGTLAKNRRGSGKFTIIATGQSAHVGRAFNEGRNAIAYLAEILISIHALNTESNPRITINIGKIAGGDALNVVPDKAVAKLDIRISDPDDEKWVMKRLNQIIHQQQRPAYTLTLHGGFTRPVKSIDSGTLHLYEKIQAKGKILGLSIDWKDSGGCCDGNNLAKHQIPVIDTLGVRGGSIHSANEFICLDSLSERAALSFLILEDLASGGLEELKR